MIEILTPGQATPTAWDEPLPFIEIQKLVKGYVQMVDVDDKQLCMNEDGMAMGLPFNELATARYRHRVNLGPQGALGIWVVLSGKDLLK